MYLYQLGVITFFVLEKYLLEEFVRLMICIPFILTKVVAIFFCGIELVSINENIKAVKGINLFQMFKQMLTRVKDEKKDIVEIVSTSSTATYTNQVVTPETIIDKTLTVTTSVDILPNSGTTT